jgi:acetyl-CoA/propionyl-CoA carboxylase biotin carboxyl carrier protein
MADAPFAKILIANRGEIAVRIIRAAKELGCATVAVYSDVDRDALHVRLADEAYHLGPAAPAQSYLNAERLLGVAQAAGASAIHPGYGFFAENAAFARAVIAAGMSWIGPHPGAIEAMGDKIRARIAMIAAGVPVVPGGTSAIADASAARAAALAYGLPLALKASGGGGGKGLKIARSLDEIAAAFSTARREAAAYFNDPTIYAERYLENPKHIELQILADKHGHTVHVGERDCSLQRRHQKVWEETPARISVGVRERLRAAGIAAAQSIGYDSVGTIECLVAGDEFFFLEMNTRIQVEHTISEEISGIDLVAAQICVAAGWPLAFTQSDVAFHGHAIEVRLNAEDPRRAFAPAPGTITAYREPGGLGVRVDSAAFPGSVIPPDYDSLIAKLIVHAPDRPQALRRLARALDEYHIVGIPTTRELLRALVDFAPVVDATYGTATLEPFATSRVAAATDGAAPNDEPAAAAPGDAPVAAPGDAPTLRVEVNGKLYRVKFFDLPAPSAEPHIATRPPRRASLAAHARRPSLVDDNDIYAPMHGVVVDIPVAVGDEVAAGQVLIVIEAMKMMNEIRAPHAGAVARIHTSLGATVEAQTALLTLS